MIWKPHATVAAVIEDQGRYLFVEELIGGRVQLNQPAGHLEPGESLLDACIRETIEETGLRVQPIFLLGVYQWRADSGESYLRFAFGAKVEHAIADAVLDQGILRPLWLTAEEAAAREHEHRSPLVMACLHDHRAGKRCPLDLIRHFA